MTPSQRCTRYLQDKGWTTWRVEHWNSFAHRRQDLYGFADLIGYSNGKGIALFQVTTDANRSARRTKILENNHARGWIASGGHIYLVTCGKHRMVGTYGRKTKREEWQIHSEEISF